MTAHKHLKQLVRKRMEKTGESYTTARRQVLRQTPTSSTEPTFPWHFPGSTPAATALRSLLAHAGVAAPHTNAPFTEAMAFGLAGGIGAGMFTFFYEKEGFASFFVAGRHSWQDDVAYFQGTCQRLGLKPRIVEATGAKAAAKQLTDGLATEGPCVAWVDMATLPHRAMPCHYQGGSYHVVTIYRVDKDEAWIGDLGDQPVAIKLADLANARARIKKQKNRLLWLPAGKKTPDLASLVKGGLQACHQGLTKQRMQNFTLESFRTWGERLHGSKDKESWERIFAPPRLWQGLVMAHDFIENYGTGGGLCRPIFAEFLAEAATALKDPRYQALSERYAVLGRSWSALADACLPADIPIFQAARKWITQRNEAITSGGPAENVLGAWEGLTTLGNEVKESFPLSAAECADLRADLQRRVLALYEGEKAALTEVAKFAS